MRKKTLRHFGHRRAARNRQTKEVFDLAGGNQDRSARGKAHHYGVRDKIHQGAQPQNAQQQLEHAHKKGQGQHQRNKLRAARLGQRAHGGEHDDGNGGGRPRHQMPGRPPQRRHHGWQHGRIQAVLRWHARNRGKGHALRHQNQTARQASQPIGAQTAPVDPGPPAQKRQQTKQKWMHKTQIMKSRGLGQTRAPVPEQACTVTAKPQRTHLCKVQKSEQ